MPATHLAPDAQRISDLRKWIAAAERDGVAADDMLLRLTVRDAASLKRHPSVAVHEVAFADGEMRFLGVKVQQGGVAESELHRGA